MDRRNFLALTGSLALSPVLAADEKKTIKLVSSLPRLGAAKTQTDAIVNAIRLAIADYSKQMPFVVKYDDLDDATAEMGYWDAGREAENARAAANDEAVVAYIGPYNSGAAKVSMPILNEAGMIQVTPSATWPGLTKKLTWTDPNEPVKYRPAERVTFCRVCPTDEMQGQLTAHFVAKELKAKSVYILDDHELYGEMCANTFETECKELGIKVLGRESINPAARSLSALTTKVKNTNPDAVYFGGTSQSGDPQLAKDFAASGMKCPLILPDGCYEKAFLDAAGADTVNGRCLVTMGGVELSQLGARGVAFAKRYKEAYKIYKIEPEAYSLYGYEAAAVILEAIKTVGKADREAIRKAVLATKDFDKGVLGKWSFDANGDTTLQQITVSKIEKGKFVPFKVVTAEAGRK